LDETRVLGPQLRAAESQRRSGQLAPAARILEPLADSAPVAAFYLGLVREDQGRIADARQLYQRYIAKGQNAALRDRLRDRLVLLDRRELELAVQDALAHERDIRHPPEARTIGVFPFLISTADQQLRPLGTAFAELLSTDLAQTTRLHVVERSRMQELIAELKLAESGRTDPATAVRSGRIVAAGTVVQGRVEGSNNDLAVQAAVVRVPTEVTTALPATGNPLREHEALTRMFDLEKRLALGIYARMGVELSTAERQRVMHQPTNNVQALLELGYGLEAQDAQRYAEASAHFARAAQLDPNFTLAQQRAQEATAQTRALDFPTQQLAELALAAAPATAPGAGRIDVLQEVQRLVPDPSVRNPTAEAIGTEGLGRRGTVDIVIRRP
jgi:tetratricopeptide (TPR) repeat protein